MRRSKKDVLIIFVLLFSPSFLLAFGSIHSFGLKGGIVSLNFQDNIYLNSQYLSNIQASLPGPMFNLEYNYYLDPEICNWLGLTAEIGYYGVNGAAVTGSPVFFSALRVPTNILPSESFSAQVIPIKLGPKIALLAMDRNDPWKTSHLYIGGGVGIYPTTINRAVTYTILDPNVYWVSTGTHDVTHQVATNNTGINGFFSTGGSLILMQGISLNLEYGYDFYFGSSVFTGGLSAQF